MRTILSPSFTTNKMKNLFQIMDKSGSRFLQYFLEQKEDIFALDMQDVFTRFTNDVIASSVFGAEVDSLKEPNNEFYVKGKYATDLTIFPTNLKVILSIMHPGIYRVNINVMSVMCLSFGWAVDQSVSRWCL